MPWLPATDATVTTLPARRLTIANTAARQAWKRELGAEYTFASDFWGHGIAAKSYGVFNEEIGAPIRGTFLIDRDGVVMWSLVKDASTRRTELVPGSLETLDEQA